VGFAKWPKPPWNITKQNTGAEIQPFNPAPVGEIDRNMMASREYEEQYSEALAELRSRGYKVASPYTGPDGVRRVQINNFPSCIDRLVFEKAWGQLIADQVMRKKSSPH
jgi:hypothetical protein